MKTKLSTLAISVAAIAMSLVACSGDGQPEVPVAPTTAEAEQVEATEAEQVEATESEEPTAPEDETIDFEAIRDADTELWQQLLLLDDPQGATGDALLTQFETDLNTQMDRVLSAVEVSVANLNFEQISNADTAVWGLLLVADSAGQHIDVTPLLEKIIDVLDQAGATLVTTGSASDVDTAVWGFKLAIESAEELLDPTSEE